MISSDRELLELAAKAAGIELRWIQGPDDDECIHPIKRSDCGRTEVDWLPLTDDGDALQLAVTLALRVECYTRIKIHPKYGESHVTDVYSIAQPEIMLSESHNGDPCRATRRAIVRAAAEIGRSMP